MSKSINSLLKAVKTKFLGLGLNAKSWIQKGGTVPIEVFPIDLLEKEKLINAPLRSGEIVMSKKEYEVKLKKKTVKTFTKTFWCKNCSGDFILYDINYYIILYLFLSKVKQKNIALSERCFFVFHSLIILQK